MMYRGIMYGRRRRRGPLWLPRAGVFVCGLAIYGVKAL